MPELDPLSHILLRVGPDTGHHPKVLPSQKIRGPEIPPLEMHFFACIMSRNQGDAEVVFSGTVKQIWRT